MCPIALLSISLIVRSANTEAENHSVQLSQPCQTLNCTGGTCQENSTTCTCLPEHVAYDNRCVPRLFDPDWNNTEAYGDAGNCTTGSNNDICGVFGAACAGTIDKQRCKCPDFTVHQLRVGEKSDFCVPISYKCADAVNCSDPNGNCSGGECSCREGYYAAPNDRKMCVTNQFNTGGCGGSNLPCEPSLIGYCLPSDNKTCECWNRQENFLVDSICTTDSFYKADCKPGTACGFGNGMCDQLYRRKCICGPGYIAEGVMCVRRWFKPKSGCPANEACGGLGGFGVCNTEGTCLCKNGSFAKHDQCVKRYFDTPWCEKRTGPCGDGYGKCVRHRCLCSSNQYEMRKEAWAYNLTCVSATFKEKNCSKIGLVCSYGNGRCTSYMVCRCIAPLLAIPRQIPRCYNESAEAKQVQSGSGAATAVVTLGVCFLSLPAVMFARV